MGFPLSVCKTGRAAHQRQPATSATATRLQNKTCLGCSFIKKAAPAQRTEAAIYSHEQKSGNHQGVTVTLSKTAVFSTPSAWLVTPRPICTLLPIEMVSVPNKVHVMPSSEW